MHLSGASSGAKLMLNSTLVIIVDDHEPGQLSFPERFYTVKESQQVRKEAPLSHHVIM
eukprot:COSAG06_NODE_25103_length_645_cov_0.836996_1_plen_57_part_10